MDDAKPGSVRDRIGLPAGLELVEQLPDVELGRVRRNSESVDRRAPEPLVGTNPLEKAQHCRAFDVDPGADQGSRRMPIHIAILGTGAAICYPGWSRR
jgi:hypothetical protein